MKLVLALDLWAVTFVTWAWVMPAQTPLHCTNYSILLINGQQVNHHIALYNGPLLRLRG